MKWQTIVTGSVVWYAIRGRECVISLVPRPAWCDRGNWLAMIFATGDLARSLDGADLWPRYYFDRDRAFAEVEAWMHKRGKWTDDDAEAMSLAAAAIGERHGEDGTYILDHVDK